MALKQGLPPLQSTADHSVLPADAGSPADTAGTHESFPGAGGAHDSFAGLGGAGADGRIPDVGASWPSQAFGSLQFQASQPQATVSQAMVSSGLPTLGSGRDWQPPQDQLGRFIPPGLVSRSGTKALHACRDGPVSGRLDCPMENPYAARVIWVWGHEGHWRLPGVSRHVCFTQQVVCRH